MDITNRRYGHLTAIEDSGQRRHKNVVWRCICDCGNETLVTTNSLNMGNTKSCGCARTPLKLASSEAGFRELLRSYQRDAKRRGYAFEIDSDLFKSLVTQPCTYCGLQCMQVKFSRGKKDNPGVVNSAFMYTGLDREDNAVGYTEENSVPCCQTCNIAKRNLTREEFEEWIRRVYHHLGNR